MGRRRPSVFVGSLLLVLALAACSSETSSAPESALDDASVTVGSFDFPESALLAEIYTQALETEGVDVRRAFNLGPREFVAPALLQGLIELVPEYAGTALQYHGRGDEPAADVDTTHRALVDALADTSVRALASAEAVDANTFVVTRATAEKYGLRTISDLAGISSRLTFAGPPECEVRPFCLAGLRVRYGLQFEKFVALDAGGPLTRQALANDEVDIALFFGSDPTLADDDLVQLADDRFLQPAENVTPLVRAEVLRRWDRRVVDPINAVSARLDRDGLRDLNGLVAAGTPVRRVARTWLESQGLR